ncbi:histone H1/H5 family protein, partial [Ralstonia pseudosolanacearum]|uniref:histone H1/H5 family protein n=1 Tax=Ralstonia pseudosolanacearum TaxID=1310165 RepID=UPI003CF063D3
MAAVEEPIAPVAEETNVADPPPPETAEEAKETKAGKATKAKKAPKAKKPAAPRKSKAPSAHPSYLEMITEAITTLKERTGSSQFAIAKFVEDKYKSKLPANFKKLLLVQLKKLVASGKLVKVKNSFKLAPKASTPKPTSTKKSTAAKPKPKPKAAAAK